MNKKHIQAIACLVGAVFVILGIILHFLVPSILHKKIMEALVLVNMSDSEVFSAWVEHPVPIYMKFYLFNVTNPQDILINSSKPTLQEMGPYTFREYRQKVDIQFSDDGETVSYKLHKRFDYLPNQSNGSLMDNVTVLNVPFMAMAMETEGKLNLAEMMILPQIIKIYKATPFVTKTVDELLFKGYKDNLIMYLESQSGKKILPNGTFGFFYERNDTYDDYSVSTGKKDLKSYLEIHKWNNKSSLGWWNSKYCNMINGTDGAGFSPFLKQNKKIYMFIDELCRSIYLDYEKIHYKSGIKIHRYVLSPSLFKSPDIKPENKCYCNKTKKCLKSGAFDISPCHKGTPVVLSLPHFYQGDDSYNNAVIGLNRSENRHRSILDLEPDVKKIPRNGISSYVDG
uniref:Scavenger receptor class B member 1 n=1 Tax=Strigamia maritima TaxID=126957 RepID=T1IJJ6_STRMM